MESTLNIWNLVEQVVKDEGFVLFDLELPTGKGRSLRVFISGEDHSNPGVNLDDCARVSRRLSDVLDAEVEIAGRYILEVSSPGINRKLRRPEHFVRAVGERVRLTVVEANNQKRTMHGIVAACDGQSLDFEEEERKARLTVPLSHIADARVAFIFQ